MKKDQFVVAKALYGPYYDGAGKWVADPFKSHGMETQAQARRVIAALITAGMAPKDPAPIVVSRGV